MKTKGPTQYSQNLSFRKENLTFDNNYIIQELSISIKMYPWNHVSVATVTTQRMIPSETNSPPVEVST
jgi:hypothetical protein